MKVLLPLCITFQEIILLRPVIRRFNDNTAAGGAEGALTE